MAVAVSPLPAPMTPPEPALAGRQTLIYWLGQALKRLRQESPGLKQVRIAATAGVDQSTIWRLEEEAHRWPRHVEVIVAAYAEELELDPRDIWAFAFELWRHYGEAPTVSQLSGIGPRAVAESPIDAARQSFERAIVETAPKPAAAQPRPSRKSRAT